MEDREWTQLKLAADLLYGRAQMFSGFRNKVALEHDRYHTPVKTFRVLSDTLACRGKARRTTHFGKNYRRGFDGRHNVL